MSVLVGSRFMMTVIALAIGAKVAGSSAPITMLLGINRLGQAAIVMRHALATGHPVRTGEGRQVIPVRQPRWRGVPPSNEDGNP